MEERYHLWPDATQRLLLHTALGRGTPAVDAFERWQAAVDIEEELAWNSLRLLPLAYTVLADAGYSAPIMGRLKGVYRRAWFENNRLFHRVEPVVRALHEADIDLLLLKGVPLAHAYYPHPALRPMSDLDVCIHEHQLDGAVAVLRDLGWQVDAIHRDQRRFRHALQIFHPDGSEIDLHWHVLPDARGATRSFWRDAEPFEFRGLPLRQLSPGHALLHAVVHGVRCNPEPPIRWIPDALAILTSRGADIQWDAVLALARRTRIAHRFALGMQYLTREFAAPVPTEVAAALEATRPVLIERLENTVVLSDYSRFLDSPTGNAWVMFTEYLRCTATRNPLRFTNDFVHYVRFHMGLDGRRELLPRLVQGVKRRVA